MKKFIASSIMVLSVSCHPVFAQGEGVSIKVGELAEECSFAVGERAVRMGNFGDVVQAADAFLPLCMCISQSADDYITKTSMPRSEASLFVGGVLNYAATTRYLTVPGGFRSIVIRQYEECAAAEVERQMQIMYDQQQAMNGK